MLSTERGDNAAMKLFSSMAVRFLKFVVYSARHSLSAHVSHLLTERYYHL
jgi:hypothetical protein